LVVVVMMMMIIIIIIIILTVTVTWTIEPVLTLAPLDSSSDASRLRLVKRTFRILAATQTILTDFFGGFPQCRQVMAGVVPQLGRHSLLPRCFTAVIHQILNHPG
jgi:hypothetical protein